MVYGLKVRWRVGAARSTIHLHSTQALAKPSPGSPVRLGLLLAAAYAACLAYAMLMSWQRGDAREQVTLAMLSYPMSAVVLSPVDDYLLDAGGTTLAIGWMCLAVAGLLQYFLAGFLLGRWLLPANGHAPLRGR